MVSFHQTKDLDDVEGRGGEGKGYDGLRMG